MTKPVVAGKEPAVLTLSPGTYWWCACGRSKRQPFCDGGHQETSLRPERLEIAEAKEVALCMCKQTDDPPFCDGTHKDL